MEQELEQLPGAEPTVTARVPAAVEVSPIDDADEAFQSPRVDVKARPRRSRGASRTDAGRHDFERNVRSTRHRRDGELHRGDVGRDSRVVLRRVRRVTSSPAAAAANRDRVEVARPAAAWRRPARRRSTRVPHGAISLAGRAKATPRYAPPARDVLRGGTRCSPTTVANSARSRQGRAHRTAEPGFWSEAELDA